MTIYVDNEAARFALIKGSSPTRESAWLVNEIWKTAAELEADLWIERVPSASNCADHPSRGSWEVLPDSGLQTKKGTLQKHFESRLVAQWCRLDEEDEPLPEADRHTFL